MLSPEDFPCYRYLKLRIYLKATHTFTYVDELWESRIDKFPKKMLHIIRPTHSLQDQLNNTYNAFLSRSDKLKNAASLKKHILSPQPLHSKGALTKDQTPTFEMEFLLSEAANIRGKQHFLLSRGRKSLADVASSKRYTEILSEIVEETFFCRDICYKTLLLASCWPLRGLEPWGGGEI